jgi:ankyrin repeat protein
MKLLLKHGAKMEKDAYGMTPLMAASVAGFSKIVEFLIGRSECTKQERIDALELLGATYVDKKRDMLGAINFWRQAMEDRSSEPALPKPRQGSQIESCKAVLPKI